MERAVESGLEVNVPTDPQVVAQPDSNMYSYGQGVGEPKGYNHGWPHQSVPFQVKSKARSRALWILAVVAVVSLAIALGAGLGVGLKFQHKSSSFM